jgi:hypothetical protein
MVDSPLQIGGPGKFSVREDLPPSQNYGDRKAMAEQIAGAATTAQPSARPAPAADIRTAAAQEPTTSLYAPTQRPDEPITAGIALGPGPGPEARGGRPVETKLSDTLAALLPYDSTGEISVLYQMALSRGQ